MKIKRRYKLLIIAISLFIVDFGLTFYFLNYTSFAEEGNPLFQLDGGYISLIVNFIYIISVFIIGVIVENYQSINLEAHNTLDYINKLYKTDRTDFIVISLMTAFVYATFTSRLVAIMDWIVYGIYQTDFHITTYAIIRSAMPLGRYDISVALVSFVLYVLIWFKFEYRKSKKVY